MSQTFAKFVAGEGTTISMGATPIGQVLSVTPPGRSVESVKTTHLGSAAQNFRPGQIPDGGKVKLRILVNPADAGYAALLAAFTPPITTQDFTISYPGDGMTNHGSDAFNAVIESIEPDDLEENSNLEVDVTLQVNGVVTNTAGS